MKMNMIKSAVIATLIIASTATFSFSGANAFFKRGGASTSVVAGATQTNTSSNDLFGGVLNAIDNANQFTFGSGVTPAQLDANGYPGSTLTGGQTISFAVGFLDSQTGSATSWLFKWTPAGDAVYFLNAGWTNVVSSGCVVSGNSSVTTVTMTAGTPCRVTFTWVTPPGFNLLTQFRAAAYAPNSPKMVLCRASDEAAITANKIFTSEYLSVYSNLHLRTLRTMPWNNAGSSANTNQSKWAYRSTLSSLGYNNSRFPPGAWGGTASGTDQYTVAKPTDSGSSGWVDGEVIQADILNSSTTQIFVIGAANNGSGLIRLTVGSGTTTAALTTGQQVYVSSISGTWEANGVQTVTVIDATHVDLQGTAFANAYQNSAGGIGTQTLTVTGKTGGTKFVAQESGAAPYAAFTSGIASGLGTFVYNSLLDVVMWSSNGITANIPIEAQVNLANALNVNLWVTFPTYANDAFIASEVTLIRDSLNLTLTLYGEYSNEVWNNGFPQTGYAANMGNYLGGVSYLGFYSLRVRQIMSNISTIWTATRSANTLKRVLAWQGFGDPSVVTYRLESGELNSATNARLLAYAGSVNYTVQGQRAIDFADVGSYATYFTGAAMQNGFANYNGTPADVISILQNLANLFNANPNDATALAIVDNDLRQGTSNTKAVSSVSGTTINVTANGYSNGQIGVFTTTGALYSGLSLNTPYYVVNAATNSFSVSATYNGSAISLSGGSGSNSFGILGAANDAPQTLLNLSSMIYQNVNGNHVFQNPGWEQVAASYDAYRTSVGQAALKIELYEGGLEARAPTAAQCTTMGITVAGSAATASAALTAGLEAYKNSSYSSAIALSQFKQFKGTDSAQPLTFGLMVHSTTPSWFLLVGPSQWALLPGLIDSAPYQTYNGVAAFP